MIVLTVVNAQFKNYTTSESNGKVSNEIEVWLMFIPSMVFGLLCDSEILV